MTRTLEKTTTPEAPSLAHRLRALLFGRSAAIIALLVVVWIIASVSVENFNTPNTLYFLILDVFPVLLIALPMTFIIITGEIDLSVASMVGLSSVTIGALFQAGVPVPVAIVIALIVGLAGGAVNGFLVTTIGLPSLAVTIGSLALYRGIAVGILGTTAITGFPEMFGDLVKDRLFGRGTAIPGILIVFIVLAIIAIVLLHATSIGRSTYAIGLNKEASLFSGIDAGRLKFWFFVASGVVSALAGAFWTLRYDSARGDNAMGLELVVVAAVLVGGVSIFGGRGSLVGVIAGVLVIGALRSALRLADVSSDVINVATGLLLVVSVIVPSIISAVTGFAERRRAAAAAS
ncbi:ABC transporter permease [Paramicrobacterium agarici]|uniref:Autoinducer 2 import system permease protein LsrD n=1 Tax=Paramicrobacterium agarici TaxID=630514 RepID=A0A2A9DTU5_9MICO|nr:ABC transporter permease [Microbacterium agarici]PFG29330.1 rhamnose transport system permease protein [Microbacterium agarici]TQO22332.1 rhamnose transport system permease protein [Microbacterium agarici]